MLSWRRFGNVIDADVNDDFKNLDDLVQGMRAHLMFTLDISLDWYSTEEKGVRSDLVGVVDIFLVVLLYTRRAVGCLETKYLK